MNKCNAKKYLIRHIEDPFPYVHVEQKIREEEPVEYKPEEVYDENFEDIQPQLSEVSEPKRNYIKCVENKIRKIEDLKPRKIKSLSQLPKANRITYDEKITKQVNFPFDKTLYKKLISLQLVEKPVLQTVPVNYEATIRDRTPRLEDFFTPSTKPEYRIPVSSTLGGPTTTRNYDGLRLHKIMTTWKDNRAK